MMQKTEGSSIIDIGALVEAALLTDVMLVLMFMRSALPLLSLFMQLLTPVPIAVVSARRGIRPSLLGTITAWVMASSFLGVISGIWGLFYAMVGVILGEMIRRKVAFWWIVLGMSIAYVLLLTFSLMAVARVLGLGPVILLQRFENAVTSALQPIQHLDPVGRIAFYSVKVYPLAVLSAGYLLVCFIYSLALCAIVSRVLSTLD